MNYEQAKQKAKENYEKDLARIELGKILADKIEPMLPKGWTCEIDSVIYSLELIGNYDGKEEVDANEFKLVCKLIESATGEKVERKARVNKSTNKITLLQAEAYFTHDGTWIGIHIYLHDPKQPPNCEITWKRRWRNEAIISDECLGIHAKS